MFTIWLLAQAAALAAAATANQSAAASAYSAPDIRGGDRQASTANRLAAAPAGSAAVRGPAAAAGAADGYARYNRFTAFDRHFSKYSKRYFGPAFDWRYFKAQAVAESSLDPDARSAAGAVGVMQIMPRTFAEIRQRHPAIAGPADDPRWNIAAGIWYDRQQFLAWAAARPLDDRIRLMFASYNAGPGSLRRAQRAAQVDGRGAGRGGVTWAAIERALPGAIGRRARATIAYVARIFEIKEVLR